jgi:hypothetical protein
MTISIMELLGQTLDGAGSTLKKDEVVKYIAEHYVKNDDDIARRARHRQRQLLYDDDGIEYMNALIDGVFKDPDIRALRKAWAKNAKFDNLSRRITNERSTSYQIPAQRTVGGQANNKKYKELQRLCKQDQCAIKIDRMLSLHRAIVVGFRVRNLGSKAAPDNAPVIDIVTPDQCFLIVHPKDPTQLIGIGIKLGTKYARKAITSPCWVVWTDHERFHLDVDGDLIKDSWKDHGLASMHYTFITLEPPTSTLWPGMAGEDLTAAHMSNWFTSTCLLKEVKSSTKKTTLSGDTTTLAREQAADTEIVGELGEGVAMNTTDMGMDLRVFRDTSVHVSDTAANNYGISSALKRHQGVQSAEARDLMRVPLRELRLERNAPLRDFERRFAEIQVMVLESDLPELLFELKEWHINFSDPQTPLTRKEGLEVFEHSRRLGLDSTPEYLMRQDPDLDTEKAAWDRLLKLIADETLRNTALRPLKQISGSFTAPVEQAQPPSQEQPEGNDKASEEEKAA